MERGMDGTHRTQLRGTEREAERQRETERGGEAVRLKRRERGRKAERHGNVCLSMLFF